MIKLIEISLFILTLIPFNNIFPQYFVDQDKIEQLRTSKGKYYNLPYEEGGDKPLYLKQISSHKDYYSDIKVGFDKEEYNSNDMIIVTLKRGVENKTESEEVWISGACDTIFSDEIEVQKHEPGPYYLYLKKGQTVKIYLSCKNRKDTRLNFNFGPIITYGWAMESREYIIRYSDGLKEETPEDSVSGNTLIIRNIQPVSREQMKVPTIKEEEKVK